MHKALVAIWVFPLLGKGVLWTRSLGKISRKIRESWGGVLIANGRSFFPQEEGGVQVIWNKHNYMLIPNHLIHIMYPLFLWEGGGEGAAGPLTPITY